MYVYVVDDRLGNRLRGGGVEVLISGWLRFAQGRPGPKRVIRVNEAWSVDRICRRIREAGLIRILYLCGHGRTHQARGYVELGHGLTLGSARSFELLRHHWAGRYPRIEVHSCGVASVTRVRCRPNPNYDENYMWNTERSRICTGISGPAAPGHRIMQALADAAGVLVMAGVDDQWPDARFQFEGPVRHYRPAEYFVAEEDLRGSDGDIM